MMVICAFVALSALLVAGGARMIVELDGALEALFADAVVPHVVQMHAGDLDPDEIKAWAEAQELVSRTQIVEMVTIDGSSLTLGAREASEAESVMDLSLVTQNRDFDYLLDLENRRVQPAEGEIGVPVYYLRRDGLEIGDTVRVAGNGFYRQFRISAFVRDAQMNPAIVHSKRFVLSEADYAALRGHFDEVEYLIEFRMTDPERTDALIDAYAASGLPKRGPTVDHGLFRVLNALTDGMVAAVVIILSLLLMVVAILCLRFTILAAVEEDYREIGVMKAIGMAGRDIRRIYLAKYIAVGAIAVLAGYLASLPLSRVLSGSIALAIGSAPASAAGGAVPLAAATLLFLAVVVAALRVLSRFRRISAVEALRSAGSTEAPRSGAFLPVSRTRLLGINVFLGARDAAQRFRLFGLLTGIFVFSAFITIVPVHFLGTMTSPSFISYMGIGSSDLRIDLRQTEEVAERFDAMVATLAADEEVERFAPFITSQVTLLTDSGEEETIAVESGDFSLFPLDYLAGAAPGNDREIALSYLNARDMDKEVGDTVRLLVGGEATPMRVSGIYQDVTNGGRTAKASMPFGRENALWYTVGVDLASPDLVDAKVAEYSQAFHPARVTDLEGYVAQTLGNTISQLGVVTLVAVAAGIAVAVLITALFLKMLVVKDVSRIAIMKSLGFSLRHIRIQYLTTALVLLTVGIAAGTVVSNTLGQGLVGALWSFMGAARIRFVVDPLRAYVLLPLLLALAVGITTFASISRIKETNIAALIAE